MIAEQLINEHRTAEAIDETVQLDGEGSEASDTNGHKSHHEEEQIESPAQHTTDASQHDLDYEEIRAAFEALLFVSHDPLSLEKLSSVLEGVPKPSLKAAMERLQTEYEETGRGLQVREVAGGYVMVTRREQHHYIKRLAKAKPASKVSRSALEALAIIGYKQPITRADIEKIRGVETSGVLRTLLDQKLIRIVGRQDIPGRPILYGTTKQFLQRFGLRDLRDLPPLKELKDLGSAEQFPMELPFNTDEDEGGTRVADLSA